MRIILILLLTLLNKIALSQTEDSILCNNAALHYYAYGKGESIVILSGGPGLSSHQEDDLAIKLSEKYKAILVDQRGTGKSWTKPLDSTTINIESYIEDLELLRKKLNLNQLILSGHSWGGMLATAYTAKYPQHVKGVILIGPGELDTNLNDVVNDNIDTRFQLSDTTTWYYWKNPENKAKDSLKADYEIRKITWSLLSYDRSKLDAITKQAQHGKFNTEVNRLMWKSIKRYRTEQLENIAKAYKGKALIIFGWQDPIAQITLYEYIKTYPMAEVKGINKCGHMPSVEQPEAFYTSIFQFLERINKQK